MSDFKFKPFEEMTPEDYAEIGFKSGLEVHQQLLTEKKLFCRCPAGHYSQDYHAEILRHMRPTLSELGEYDGTALMEFKTKKDIIYRINRETVCTYEMDDTPPFQMNDQALDIAIEIGMLTDANVVDEIHIARKQYLDGSIPTGFQRTAIVSVGGRVPYKDRYINLIQMSIEEDSCREVSDVGHTRVYIADRLGMPLIETVTHPEMKTPQEVAEVNEILRRLVRSTGHVRTGIGAGREDVNVSVRGGTRIEIKGVSKIKNIPLLTYNEAMRQWNLLRLRDEMRKRDIKANTLDVSVTDVTHLLKKTSYKPITDAIADGKFVKCVLLRKCKDLLKWQTQTDTTFAKEISDRVRVIACLTTLPNMTHSDYPGQSISSSEGQKIRKKVNANDDDAMVLVWGDKRDSDTAAKEVIIRVREATIGIPSETRQALRDGTNGFERILPGPERMYPDTDLPPIKVTEDRRDDIRAGLPDRIWDREKWYAAIGVPQDIIRDLAVSKFAELFKKFVEEWKIDAKFASVAMIQFVKRLKKKKSSIKSLDINVIDEVAFENIFKAYKDGKILKEGVYVAMENVLLNETYSDVCLPLPATDKDYKAALMDTVEAFRNKKLYNSENKIDLMTAYVNNKLRGKAEYDKTAAFIKDNLNEEA